jgi:CRISPR-associated endonuclease/helicase Cas3
VVVLVPEERDLSSLIGADGKPRGPHGLGPVYEDLRVLEATWRTLVAHPELHVPARNRFLVESTTHPDVLQRIAAEGGGRWKDHEEWLLGKNLAEGRIAGLNRLPRKNAFSDVRFPSREDRRVIVTRLGEDDRLARFDPPVASPFGERFTALRLPAYWTRGVPPDVEEAERVTPIEDGFTFHYGPCLFRYDRLGVVPVEETET